MVADDHTAYNESALSAIRAWHADELDQPHQPGAELLMGCPVWGEAYVRRFLDFGLPSILASRADLQKCELVLYVDQSAYDALIEPMLASGLQGCFRFIPPAIMDIMARGGVSKYWLLAAVHHSLVVAAGRIGAAFHMTVADVAYSDGYFGRLKDLGRKHDAIAQTGLTIASATAGPLFEKFRRPDGTLAIPARSLGQIGWENLVGQWKGWAMDGIGPDFAEMPDSHFIHWRGPDSVRIHCSHQSPIWISPRLCAAVSPEFGGTLDSELPRYLGREFYIPTPDDDMAYCALDDDRTIPTPRVPFEKFKTALLNDMGGNADFMAYFKTPCIVPAIPTEGYPSDAEIDQRFAQLVERLAA